MCKEEDKHSRGRGNLVGKPGIWGPSKTTQAPASSEGDVRPGASAPFGWLQRELARAATASIVTAGGQGVSWRECAPHSRCKTLGGNPAVSHTRCTSYRGKPGPQSRSWFPGNFLSGGKGLSVLACQPH